MCGENRYIFFWVGEGGIGEGNIEWKGGGNGPKKVIKEDASMAEKHWVVCEGGHHIRYSKIDRICRIRFRIGYRITFCIRVNKNCVSVRAICGPDYPKIIVLRS